MRFNAKSLLATPLLLGIGISYADNTNNNLKDKMAADNSAVNARKNELTAEDQLKGSASDVEITRKIRRHLVEDSQLSAYAKNIKIVTLNGIVTLIGPVRSAEEKQKILAHASMLVRASKIRDSLEVVQERGNAR